MNKNKNKTEYTFETSRIDDTEDEAKKKIQHINAREIPEPLKRRVHNVINDDIWAMLQKKKLAHKMNNSHSNDIENEQKEAHWENEELTR